MALYYPIRSPSNSADWRIAFGPEPTSESERRSLAAAGITHVLDLRAESTGDANSWANLGVSYDRDPQIDDGRRQPVSSYVDGVSFAQDALETPGAKVFVHCAAGQYRSPAMVYAVLRAAGYSPSDAWAMVVGARANVYDQYRASAEAAVASLPSIDRSLVFNAPVVSDLARAFWAAVLVGGVTWAGWKAWREFG